MDPYARPVNSPKYPRLVKYYDQGFFSVGETEARVNLENFDEQKANILYKYICQDFERREVEFEIIFNNGKFNSDDEVLLELLQSDVLRYKRLQDMYFRDCEFGRSAILAILNIITTTKGKIRSIRFTNCKIVELTDTWVFQGEVLDWFKAAGVTNSASLCFTERDLGLELTLSHLAKSFNVYWDCFYGSLDLIAAIPDWLFEFPKLSQWQFKLAAPEMCLSLEEVLKFCNLATSLKCCTELELGSWDYQIPNANRAVLNMFHAKSISAIYIGYSILFPPAFPVNDLADAISCSTSLAELGLCFNFGKQSTVEYIEQLSKRIKSPNRLLRITINNRNREFDRIPVDDINRRLQRMQTAKAYKLISIVYAMTIGRDKRLDSTPGNITNGSERAACPLLMLNFDIVRKLANFLPDI